VHGGTLPRAPRWNSKGSQRAANDLRLSWRGTLARRMPDLPEGRTFVIPPQQRPIVLALGVVDVQYEERVFRGFGR